VTELTVKFLNKFGAELWQLDLAYFFCKISPILLQKQEKTAKLFLILLKLLLDSLLQEVSIFLGKIVEDLLLFVDCF
jgi:hypothetical protein